MEIVLSEYQDQLLRGVVHRMNNILSLFHGYVGLLMDDKKLDTVTREGLNRIKEGAVAASELIDRTGALVRPASPVWREVQLADLLRQMRPALDRCCKPGTKLEIIANDDLPIIRADVSRVRMGLTELVKNACEAAKNTVTVRVDAVRERVQGELFQAAVTEPEHWLRIQITDDGPGISVENAARIYEPFFSTKKKQPGAGLGLTMAMGCAQHLGGTLEHHSRPGETTFEFSLPTRMIEKKEPALSAVA